MITSAAAKKIASIRSVDRYDCQLAASTTAVSRDSWPNALISCTCATRSSNAAITLLPLSRIDWL